MQGITAPRACISCARVPEVASGGLAVCRQIVSRAPILALTANADPTDAAFYRSCGMNGVVDKPIKPERLLAAMSAVLEIAPEPETQVA